ncbi:MAG: TIGR02253 family HAD-type hydrolase [Candidatus Lokiarchaeota archaeon]|nr:TIGR02253 family HAD-type hydrolase [Candidatus Lokiarchaeota archaeon]
MCPIKLVGFDLDDCLFDSTGLSERARIKGIEAMLELGLKVDCHEAIKIIQEIVQEYSSNFSKHYDYFIRRLIHQKKRLEISFNDQYKYIAAAIIAYHKEKVESVRLYDDVEPCLINLKKIGLKSMIISDGDPIKQNEKILRLGLHKLIDNIFISDEIGIKKPNPQLFLYGLKKSGVSGQEAIYIGDRIDMDIIPAKYSKIHTVYVHRGGKHDIKKTGLKVTKDKEPDYYISSFNEIFPIIDELNEKIP